MLTRPAARWRAFLLAAPSPTAHVGKLYYVAPASGGAHSGDWRSGSAGALHAQGRGFKSLIAHQHLKGPCDSAGALLFAADVRAVDVPEGLAWLRPEHDCQGMPPRCSGRDSGGQCEPHSDSATLPGNVWRYHRRQHGPDARCCARCTARILRSTGSPGPRSSSAPGTRL